MNPFTESTVAQPLPGGACSSYAHAALVSRRRKRRALFRMALGMLAGVALPRFAHAVDVNVANQEQLQGLRGIGPKTAQVIIEERTRGGRYESLEDLSDRVKGIGPKKASALQSAGLTVGPAGPGSRPAAASSRNRPK